MASHKTFATFAALAFVTRSGASPCRPISSVVTSATLSSVVAETTTTTTIEATSTIDIISAGTTNTYATDVIIIESETASTEAATDATTVIESISTEIASTTTIAPSTTTAEGAVETLLITNGDFETGDAAPWSSSGIAAVVNVVNSESHRGTFSLVLGSQASEPVVTAQTLDKSLLVAMQPYKLSLYAKVSDATRCSNGITMFVDDGFQNSPFGTSVVVPGNQLASDWTYVSGEFTFTEAALTGSGIMRFVFKTKCSNGYFAYVDDVKMELAN